MTEVSDVHTLIEDKKNSVTEKRGDIQENDRLWRPLSAKRTGHRPRTPFRPTSPKPNLTKTSTSTSGFVGAVKPPSILAAGGFTHPPATSAF